MRTLRVGQFNDSFPPTIDGVAQAVKNYAAVLHRNHCEVTVATPFYKNVMDNYDFEVYRYHSFPMDKRVGYRAGNPFSPRALIKLRAKKFDLMHIHAPFMSSMLVKSLNVGRHVPVILTYHTKFEIDIPKRVGLKPVQKVVSKFVLDNINAADEVWAVSQKCGESMRTLGYTGEYKVMENGTDFPRGHAEGIKIAQLREAYDLPDDAFIFLFVGRLMWYKNLRLILDTLKIARERGLSFRAFLIGGGADAEEIRRYSDEIGLSRNVIFTGPIYDREYLRVFYDLADLFLFPSTYDTSGIVVKEAAACDCPALLVRDSCAAEGVEHDFSGFLAEENATSCAEAVLDACRSRDHLNYVGKNAGQYVYLSWDDAVARAYARYEEILDGAALFGGKKR